MILTVKYRDTVTAVSRIKAPTLKSFVIAHSLCKAARQEDESLIPYNPVLQQDGNNLAEVSFHNSCKENITLLKAVFWRVRDSLLSSIAF